MDDTPNTKRPKPVVPLSKSDIAALNNEQVVATAMLLGCVLHPLHMYPYKDIHGVHHVGEYIYYCIGDGDFRSSRIGFADACREYLNAFSTT